MMQTASKLGHIINFNVEDESQIVQEHLSFTFALRQGPFLNQNKHV